LGERAQDTGHRLRVILPATCVHSVSSMSKLQKIVFTYNNYNDFDYDRIKLFIETNAVYGIVGKEIASTGTHHLQGYINFGRDKRKSLATIKKEENMGKSVHVEKAKGTDEQNQKYCSKDGLFWEYGQIQHAGKRNDLSEFTAAIVAGKSVDELAVEQPDTFVRYNRGLYALQNIVRSKVQRDYKTRVVVLVGVPGTGKSRYANEAAKANGTVYYKPRGDWWDGYDGQTSIVIDDYYGWLKYDELLKICDRYPYQVPVKGGYRQFTSKNIYITSNSEIKDWYKFANYDPAAIMRRVEEYHVDLIPSVDYQHTTLIEDIDFDLDDFITQ